MFAAANYQVAINDSEIGTGPFAQAMFQALKDKPLLLDMLEVSQSIKANSRYKPVFWSFETGGEDREVIDHIDQSNNIEPTVDKLPKGGLSRFQQLELERMLETMQDLEEDYTAVTRQLKVGLDKTTNNRLERKIQQIGEDMTKVEQKISQLKKGNG